MPLIDSATDAVLLTVIVLAAFGGGLAVKAHDPSLHTDRRARATIKARNRYGLQPDTEQPDPDNTTIPEPDTIELPIVDSGDLTGRQRYSNIHAYPAAPTRERQATAEVRIQAHKILTAAGVGDIFAAVYGGLPDSDDGIPLFHATTAALAPPLPTLVGQPPRPGANVAAVIHQAALKQLDRESVSA